MPLDEFAAGDPAADFDPFTAHRQDPHLFYAAARDRPVSFSPTVGAHLVARHADVTEVLADPVTYSSRGSFPRMSDGPPEIAAVLRDGGVPDTTIIVNEDAPLHGPMRQIYELGLSGERVRSLVPVMRRRAGELIDSFSGGTAELVSQYASPFVRTVVDALLGFPPQDAARLDAWTADYMLVSTPGPVSDARLAAAHRLVEYARYLDALIEDRRTSPRDDLISDLVHGRNGIPGLERDYVHSMARGSRVAAFDTTRDAITSTLLLVLTGDRPGSADDHSHWLGRTIEESLRRDAPHRGLFRTVTADTTLGGVPLAAGSLLFLLFGSANRDPEVFARPDAVDLARPNPRAHLAFGQGTHACPGARLARSEIRIAVETLLTRLPDLRPVDGYSARYVPSLFFRGLESLSVSWQDRGPHSRSSSTA